LIVILQWMLAAWLGAIAPVGVPKTVPLEKAKVLEIGLPQLIAVRRVFVDRFSGGETADHMRDMIISSLNNANLFVLTENPERADATLRGSAEDLVFTDEHSSSDSINARANLGHSATRDQRGGSSGFGVGESESSHIAERKHEAVAAVRLVNKDGDVIWSTTQESNGAKFRGASADVADKITRQLVADYQRLK
jgi:hypothetical protein